MSSPTQEEPGLETPQDKLQQQHEQPFASEVHDKEQPGSTQVGVCRTVTEGRTNSCISTQGTTHDVKLARVKDPPRGQ